MYALTQLTRYTYSNNEKNFEIASIETLHLTIASILISIHVPTETPDFVSHILMYQKFDGLPIPAVFNL